MNVQKPTALDNKLTPMRPTKAALTTERPFQQQMQQALSSVDNFGKDVDSVLDGLHSSVNLQAEVRQARSMLHVDDQQKGPAIWAHASIIRHTKNSKTCAECSQ